MKTLDRRMRTKLRGFSVAKGKDGTFEFIGSTSSPDRAGDVVIQNWELDAFRANPVIMYGHDLGGLPIGKAEKVWLEKGVLKFRVKFVPAEVYPFAGIVAKLAELGYLRATSVQFNVLEFGEWSAEERKRAKAEGRTLGQLINRSELLELSIVSVPMNAEALIQAGPKGKIAPVYAAAKSPGALQVITKGLDSQKAKEWLSMSMNTKAKGLKEIIAALENPEGTPEERGAAIEELKELADAEKADDEPMDDEEEEPMDDAPPEEMDDEEDDEEKSLDQLVEAITPKIVSALKRMGFEGTGKKKAKAKSIEDELDEMLSRDDLDLGYEAEDDEEDES
jgi:hypothetical protein